MATYVNLKFNDNVNISLSISSFLFKNSKLLQSIDIDEDNAIPILCSSTYILDENDICLFDDKTDLSVMFTLLPNKFLEVCKFLDIICYENNDTSFSKEFITYVMTNIKKEINTIQYFMQNEIRSIMNYLNNEDIDRTFDGCDPFLNLQIKSCTPAFYALYLSEYKEEVIKYNRIDIYEVSLNKSEYYRYIHKYDNHLTYLVKKTKEYNNYIIKLSDKVICECYTSNNINKIKELVKQGANVNYQNYYGWTALHCALSRDNNLKVIKYLVEQGANVNLSNTRDGTAIHHASKKYNNLKVIKYLVEQGANINLQDNYCRTALHYASLQKNNLKTIKYLVKHGAYVNLQTSNGKTALHYASNRRNNLKVVNYLKQFN